MSRGNYVGSKGKNESLGQLITTFGYTSLVHLDNDLATWMYVPLVGSETLKSSKIINYRRMSIYRIQNGKMAETWHVIEGLPLKNKKRQERYE
jgi:hypothetical protein